MGGEIINFDGSDIEFRELCAMMHIPIVEYKNCAKCHKTMFGTCTIDSKGRGVHLECNANEEMSEM